MGQGWVDIDDGHAVDNFDLGKLRIWVHWGLGLFSWMKFNLKSILLIIFFTLDHKITNKNLQYITFIHLLFCLLFFFYFDLP